MRLVHLICCIASDWASKPAAALIAVAALATGAVVGAVGPCGIRRPAHRPRVVLTVRPGHRAEVVSHRHVSMYRYTGKLRSAVCPGQGVVLTIARDRRTARIRAAASWRARTVQFVGKVICMSSTRTAVRVRLGDGRPVWVSDRRASGVAHASSLPDATAGVPAVGSEVLISQPTTGKRTPTLLRVITKPSKHPKMGTSSPPGTGGTGAGTSTSTSPTRMGTSPTGTNSTGTGATAATTCGAATVRWSGYTWHVRQLDGLQGPGPNRWSKDNICVTGGALTMSIARNAAGQWASSEIDNEQHLGYGTYEFDVSSDLSTISDYSILGLFTYGDVPPSNNEIDIEAGHFGDACRDTGTLTVWQSASAKVQDVFNYSSRPPYRNIFSWTPRRIVYTVIDAAGRTLVSWTDRRGVPAPSTEVPKVNYWRYHGVEPTAPSSVTLTGFKFTQR